MKNKKQKQRIFEGLAISPGIAIGPAFIFRKFNLELSELDYEVSDTAKEIEIFKNACEKTIKGLQDTKEISRQVYEDEFVEIFESQIELLNDKIFMNEIINEIIRQKRPAAFVVFHVFSQKKEYFLNLDSPYFRDRAFDIADLKQKLLYVIFGVSADYDLSVPSIVIAESLSPSDTMHFNRNFLLGFITDTGGKTSHSAIIAQSLHIPSVVDKNNLSRVINSADLLIVDGYEGKIVINPDQETVKKYSEKKKKIAEFEQELNSEIHLPVQTTDGTKISIMANAEFVQEINEIKENGADGIGLFRTEGIFLERDKLPSEEEQYKVYKKISSEMGDLPVILRTVDAGGDKLIADLNLSEEQNPFLGWRAIRVCLDEPEIFKTQLRAILRANVNGNIKILIPMISCFREIQMTKEILSQVKADLKNEKKKFFENTQIGIMVETPSVALMAEQYAPEIDFFSIGTNDLTQYTLAVDRTNLKIEKLFNDSHPAILKLIEYTLKAGSKYGKEVSLCGELAGNPYAVALLIGMGIRVLSVNAAFIPKIKKIIRSVSLEECQEIARAASRSLTANEITEMNQKFFKSKFGKYKFLM